MLKSSKKIIVTGGEGMVGSLVKFGIKLGHAKLDISKPISIEKAIEKHRPEAILHLAAMTNMLECEENPKKAFRINVTGTENLAKACKEHRIKLIYMSTCAVFDGKKKTPYKESDKPNPLNVYGQTKLQGENVAKKLLPDALIIRTGWLFGGSKNNKKFVSLSLQKFKNGEEVTATSDRYGSPTYIPDLLETIENLMDGKMKGTYHVVNSGVASYFDIAKEIKSLGKFKTKILPLKARQIENPKLKRGHLEALASSKIKLRFWQKALTNYLTF